MCKEHEAALARHSVNGGLPSVLYSAEECRRRRYSELVSGNLIPQHSRGADTAHCGSNMIFYVSGARADRLLELIESHSNMRWSEAAARQTVVRKETASNCTRTMRIIRDQPLPLFSLH